MQSKSIDVYHWLGAGCALSIALVLATGCKAEVGGQAGEDSADAQVAGDAAVVDAAVDVGRLDAAPVDAAQLVGCTATYGMAPGYLLCSFTQSKCTFNATTDGGNCAELCAQFGGTCVGAFDNVDTDPCAPVPRDPPDDCTTLRRTEICECTRLDPPGVAGN